MKRLVLSVLAVAMATTAGAASAQSYRDPYASAPYGSYESRAREAAHYDYARVVRVDPVFRNVRDYPVRDARHCRTRRDDYASHDPYRDDDYYYGDGGYRDDGDYRRNEPYRDMRRDENGRMVATVIGGIAGAVLGSKIGDGSGQYIGTAVGSMVGGMAGRGIYEANRRSRDARDGYVTVCDPEPYRDSYGGYASERAVSQYDVTYEYGGREYTTRTDYHPGNRIRVRVDVRAE